MSTDIFWAFLFMGLMALSGFLSSRRVRTFDDYSVAGQNMNSLLLFATLACTVIGGATTMGFVGFVHKVGLNFFWIIAAIVLSNIFSSFFLAGPIRKRQIKSVGELYLYFYGNPAFFLANIVAFFTTVLLFGVQLTGMGKILVVLSDWNLTNCIILSTAIMLLYTWAGGIKAVARTDMIQFFFICTGLLCTIIAGITRLNGFSGLSESLLKHNPTSLNWLGNMPITALVALFFTFFFGGILSPSMVQRYASSKSEQQARRSVLLFSLFFLLFGGVIIILGLMVSGLQLDCGHEKELIVLIKTLLPEWLAGLGLAAIFAAVMSTADSFLNTSSIIFVQTIRKSSKDQQRLLFIARLVTLGIGLLGLCVALIKPEILGLVKYAFAIWAPCMLPAMVPVLVLDKKLFTPMAACCSMITGLISMVLFQLFSITSVMGIPVILCGMILSCAVLLTISAIWKRQK